MHIHSQCAFIRNVAQATRSKPANAPDNGFFIFSINFSKYSSYYNELQCVIDDRVENESESDKFMYTYAYCGENSLCILFFNFSITNGSSIIFMGE